MAFVAEESLIPIAEARLPAVSGALVSDVANIVRIETLRSSPVVVNAPGHPGFYIDRARSLRDGLIESSPGHFFPQAAHLSQQLQLREGSRAVTKRRLTSPYGTRPANPSKLPFDLSA